MEYSQPECHSEPRRRSTSPSPSITPSPAIGACPELDRSVSDGSIVSSNLDSRSVSGSSEGGQIGPQRRGYMRPQGTTFSASARNRDSVMSLGSIAHMQYYFARTGLLDGKGAQLSTKVRVRDASGAGISCGTENEIDTNEPVQDSQYASMLPPTVSTYRARVVDPQPPPDPTQLRTDLLRRMTDTRRLLSSVASADSAAVRRDLLSSLEPTIRSAQAYYTAHSEPALLSSIRADHLIRADLYSVLEAHTHLAQQSPTETVQPTDLAIITTWLDSLETILTSEARVQAMRSSQRASYTWADPSLWPTHQSRARALAFLRSFDSCLPASWPDPSIFDSDQQQEEEQQLLQRQPTPFLLALSTGLVLVKLHNALVSFSRRRFGTIEVWHEDTAVPYRAAENLRYWVKAAELRWSVVLKIDVPGVVFDRGGKKAWIGFDEAVLKWADAVREEVMAEWNEGMPL